MKKKNFLISSRGFGALGNQGFTLTETLVASLITAISMYFLISMLIDFRKSADAVRSKIVIRDYLSSSLNNIRATPSAYQMYFNADHNDVQDFLNDNIDFAFDTYQWTRVSSCPRCPGRAGFVMHPLDLVQYRGVYRVNFCASWNRSYTTTFDCSAAGIGFLVSQ